MNEPLISIDDVTPLTKILPDEPTKPQKRQRPDGEDLTRYKGCEKWTYRHWAWEFLRRNSEFQEACKSAKTDEQRQEVAAQFGLKKFKSFREAYGRTPASRPVFTLGRITSRTHLSDDNGVQKRVRANLHLGEVMIRFDLSKALTDTQVLEKQLRMASVRLKRLLAAYAAKIDKKLDQINHSPEVWGQYLRLLDGIAAGKKQVQAGLMIAPYKASKLRDPFEETTKEDLKTAINKKVKKARLYSTELYRYLAILKGRPHMKSFSLIQKEQKEKKKR